MPIYEYKCEACGLIFEKLIYANRMDSPLSCPDCESQKLNRLLSTFGFASRSGTGEPVRSSSGGGSCHSCGSKHCATCH